MTRPGSPETFDLCRQIADLQAELAHSRLAAREIDHRAANSLQIAATALKLQRRTVASEEARAVLDMASQRIGAIAHAHRFFYMHAVTDDVELSLMLSNLAANLSQGMGVDCRTEVRPVRVPAQVATQILILVNELVVNAHKHAYDGRGNGRVLISGGRVADGELWLDVADKGPGLPDGFDAHATKGLGMQLVRATVSQLGGSLRAWTDGGAHFTVTIPLGCAAPEDTPPPAATPA